jgi:putative multicomponent Na+:H+ antiporter subunit B
MIESIGIALQILLIIISIVIVFHKENFTIIIFIASFGLIAATLYAINQAPDVAIAEVAIGSAIIPLIYVISISRQREFIVLDRVDYDKYPLDKETKAVYQALTDFAEEHHLRLNICAGIKGSEKELTRELNVDLIIIYDEALKSFVLKGKSSSILMKQLKTLTIDQDFITVSTIEDGDLYD